MRVPFWAAGLLAMAASAVVLAQTPPHPLAYSRHTTHHSTGKSASKSGSKDDLQSRADRVADALAVRADHYWHEGDFESVAFCQEMIVTLDPSDVETWSDLGWIDWACLNDEPRAEKALRAGIAANPHRYDLYFDLGNYLDRRKRYGEAAATLAKAISFHDAPALVWNSYAHAIEKMGQPERAAGIWRDMKTRFPGNVHSDVNLARLKRHGLIK